MKKLLFILLFNLVFFGCTETETLKAPCDETCAKVQKNTRIYDMGSWVRTDIEVEKICSGETVHFTVGTIMIEVGTIICKDEF